MSDEIVQPVAAVPVVRVEEKKEAPKEFKPVEATPDLIKLMASAQMVDHAEVEDGLPKPIKRVVDQEADKALANKEESEVEHIGLSLAEMSEVIKKKNEVAPEFEVDSQGRIPTDNSTAHWDERYYFILKEISSEYKMARTFRRIEWKEWFNGLFSKMRIPYRFSFDKEMEVIQKMIQEVFLRINGWDDKSIAQIEEMRKDCSIEGIRNNLPPGVKLWGKNPVGIC